MPTGTKGERYITTAEAALVARMGRERLVRLAQAGEVEAVWRDGHYRISEGSLRRYLAERAAGVVVASEG